MEYGITDIIMIPWKSTIAEQSISFFSNYNFPIMPSCQDWTDEGISLAPMWAQLLRDYYAAKRIPYGLMHCRWGYGFDSELTWEQLATVADHTWSVAPYILHTPITRAKAGEDLRLVIRIEGDRYVFDGENVKKGPLPIKEAQLYYKVNDASQYAKIQLIREDDFWIGIIPESEILEGNIKYFISASDEFNTSYSPKLTKKNPYIIKIYSGNTTAIKDVL